MRVTKNNDNPINEQKIIDTIRMLGIDMIDNAKSGHPGIVLDAAPIIYTIYAHHLKFDPSNPNFYNRDRFILSAGHASSLLYATLFMAGFDIELDDLISIGTIGLIKGINSFNSSKGVRLATYVSRCVDNEILMYLRSTKKLSAEVYLEDPIGKDKDDNTITLQEILESNSKPIEDEVDLKFKIKKLYNKMKEVLKLREKTILELRFGLNGDKPKTQSEIAQMMGISRSYVSRIETKAIGKLAQEIIEE